MEKTLEITEIFTSIQGETHLAGLPTTFIRLARCNLRCSWCDTCYSFKRGNLLTFSEIIQQVSTKHVCITGGEPLLQENVHLLMTRLCDQGHKVSIETGGSLDISPIDPFVHIVLDIKCPASLMHEKNLYSNLKHIRKSDEVKFVIQNREDYEFAKEICQKYALYENTQVLLSPVHNKLPSHELVSWILEDKLPVRLNLQIHKFIWDPTTKGV